MYGAQRLLLNQTFIHLLHIITIHIICKSYSLIIAF